MELPPAIAKAKRLALVLRQPLLIWLTRRIQSPGQKALNGELDELN
jgi:hypothetical protein